MQYCCKINQNRRCRVASLKSSSSPPPPPPQPKIASYAPGKDSYTCFQILLLVMVEYGQFQWNTPSIRMTVNPTNITFIITYLNLMVIIMCVIWAKTSFYNLVLICLSFHRDFLEDSFYRLMKLEVLILGKVILIIVLVEIHKQPSSEL